VALLGLASSRTQTTCAARPRSCCRTPAGRRSARARVRPRFAEERQGTDPQLDYAGSALEAIADADAVILVTEWPEFVEFEWDAVARTMRGTLLIDGRNRPRRDAVRRAGLTYEGIGDFMRTMHVPT